jgi:hypothetical protein
MCVRVSLLQCHAWEVSDRVQFHQEFRIQEDNLSMRNGEVGSNYVLVSISYFADIHVVF